MKEISPAFARRDMARVAKAPANPQNVFSTPLPWDMVAAGYVEATMPILAQYSVRAIELGRLTPRTRVIDVACGPGTLSLMAAEQAESVHALDFSKPMLSHLRKKISKQKVRNLKVYHGDGQKLPFREKTFDVAFSMFGLMFFPDRPKGFSELFRVLKPGGRAIVSSWAPVDRSPVMKAMFGAVRAMNPDIPRPEKDAETLENPKVFRRELAAAGFRNIKVEAVTRGFPVSSVKSFWDRMVIGSAPIVLMKKKMGPKVWKEKEKAALRYLEKELPKLPTLLGSDAWIGYGEK